MKSQMTIGKKLTLSFAAMAVLTVSLGYSSLTAIGSLSSELTEATRRTARNIEIGGNMQSIAFDLRSNARAIVLASALKHDNDFVVARQKFRDQTKNLEKMLVEIRPLLSFERGRRDADQVEAELRSWTAVVEEIGKLCLEGKLVEADEVRTTKQRPIADRLAAAAQDIIEINKAILAKTASDGEETAFRSRWIAFLMIGISLATGFVVLLLVRRINRDLRQAITELSQGAEQTANAAGEVSSSSQALAQGSSEQAASLEETSASTEQISSMAQRNTENSRSAADLVMSSGKKFEQANQSLEDSVAAMDEINSQSGKISKIIKVIDEISFQTNILALNAAVEAARAGESGLGFAVVADEVRNLAQRCAQAAKDTTALIEDSNVKSRDGKIKVDQVAAAIHAITAEAMQVKTLVDDVNQGSQEQARGIEQIGRAITQMEQVTQTTAASAEEGAAAAEELNAQSETLKDIVGRLNEMVGGSLPGSNSTVGSRKPVRTIRGTHMVAPNSRRTNSHPASSTRMGSVTEPHGAGAAPAGAWANRNTIPLDDDFKKF